MGNLNLLDNKLRLIAHQIVEWISVSLVVVYPGTGISSWFNSFNFCISTSSTIAEIQTMPKNILTFCFEFCPATVWFGQRENLVIFGAWGSTGRRVKGSLGRLTLQNVKFTYHKSQSSSVGRAEWSERCECRVMRHQGLSGTTSWLIRGRRP